MRRYFLLFLLACWLQNGGQLHSQQEPNAGTLNVQVKVVNVLATVRDKHGKIVNNLTKDDFILEEDTHPQTIHYFSQETDLPLTLGLLVDTSLSQRRVLDQERSASQSFLDQMLRENKDKSFIIHFDREVELLQDLTSSRQKLESALNLLKTPELNDNSGSNSPGQSPGQSPGPGGGGGWPGSGGGWPGGRRRGGSGGGGGGHGGGGHWGGGTQLYDSVFLASDELMKKQSGRKALIILSDGVDMGSKTTLESAIEAAQRADTVVYSILFSDAEAYGGGGGFGGMGRHGGGRGRNPEQERPDGKKILARISKETGGRLFEVSKKEPIDQIYSQVSEELRNQYSLGYTPDRKDAATGYRKIHLATKQKDLAVQARDGYYTEQ
ncbi:MAG TPA: VWA domain-containing protein [Terriglobales bacterium]|jgi:VWFA-related protein|nr:VWA domain-containing protein [Terriglobales bacterium]